MLQELGLKNYQSHKDTVLKFDKGVNIIIGESDVGKTAIIRALRWLVWNRPGGDSFRSTWGGDTVVKATFEDTVVARKKGGTNEYLVNDISYSDFGANVPEDIVKILNIDEVNLQQQLDQPFLLSETPGQIATYFNKIAGIDLIDRGMKNVQKEIRDVTKVLEIRRKDLKEKKQQLIQYEDIETIETSLQVLEGLETKMIEKETEKSELENLVDNLKNIQYLIKEEQQILKAEKPVNDLLDKITERKTVETKLEKLKRLLLLLEKNKQSTDEISRYILIEPKVTYLLQLIAQKRALKANLSNFNALVGKYTALTVKVREKGLQLKEKGELFTANLTVCPICGTKIK